MLEVLIQEKFSPLSGSSAKAGLETRLLTFLKFPIHRMAQNLIWTLQFSALKKSSALQAVGDFSHSLLALFSKG